MRETQSQFKTLAICTSRLQEHHEHTMVLSIAREAKKYGFKTLIFNAYSDFYLTTTHIDGEMEIFKLLHKQRVDAIVVLSESIKRDYVSSRIVNFANENQIPVISVERKLHGNCPNIEFDYGDAFEMLVRHIVEGHNCRTVNFIAGMRDNEFSDTRLNCYKKVLAENGIPFDESRVGYGDFWAEPTKLVMEQFLADKRGLPEAIICCNDTMAMVASQMLQERGYRIPQDVLLTGFDGIDGERYATPRLTTAATDYETLGMRVMDALHMLLQGKEISGPIPKIGFKVRISQSCGCKQVGVTDAMKKLTELHDENTYTRGHVNLMFSYLSNGLATKSYKQLAEICGDYSMHFENWICLNDDYFHAGETDQKYQGVFAQEMILFAHVNNKELVSSLQRFNLEDYLPNFNQVLAEHDVLMFNAIHHLETVYGYAVTVVELDDDHIDYAQRYINNTSQIFESIYKSRKLNTAYAEMREMHLKDPLTGLYNRRGFENMNTELLNSRVQDKLYMGVTETLCREEIPEQMLLLSIDLDNLKYINDKYGHAMGDIAITSTANILMEYEHERKVCARFGGDEYVLSALATDAEALLQDITEYLEARIEEFNSSNRYLFELCMSVGAVIVDISIEDWKNGVITLDYIYKQLTYADAKMYEQKRQHKKHLTDR